MPELQVSVVLPYYIRLAAGEYPTAQIGDVVQIFAPNRLEGASPRTPVCARFNPDDSEAPEEIQKRRARCGEQLLRRINRLLRWYRSVSRRADITELTRAQISPFRFEAISGAPPAEWTAPLEYVAAGPQPAALDLELTTQAVRIGLAGGNDPDVAALFLLDAESSLHQGRFRETVLFCWSTIDSVFNRKYDTLVDAALAGDPSDARKLFKDLEFGLKNKMSIGMRVVANRSLHGEPDGLWEKVSNSYGKKEQDNSRRTKRDRG
jgi:hypothetical protein